MGRHPVNTAILSEGPPCGKYPMRREPGGRFMGTVPPPPAQARSGEDMGDTASGACRDSNTDVAALT
jgi:hypothetical protein